jgi:HSP20 family protein
MIYRKPQASLAKNGLTKDERRFIVNLALAYTECQDGSSKFLSAAGVICPKRPAKFRKAFRRFTRKGVINMTKLANYDPFRSLLVWPKWMDDFDESSHQRGLKIRETSKDIVIQAVVAGVPADDVNVHIDDGVLTIKAEAKEEKEKKDEYRSSSYQYYYTAALSGGQWNKAEAEVKHGVLKIKVPKTAAAQPRKITVKAKDKS